MPNPKYYSRLAIAVSAALASMVFSSHAAWVDVDSLPSSGLVSSLPPELQALIPAQANAHFAKTSAMPNYVYQWNAGTIPVYGHGVTLNGPGAEAFEHSLTVIQNSNTGSPGDPPRDKKAAIREINDPVRLFIYGKGITDYQS